ncbi:hypothetical protein PIB30_065056, partial [Stylosanthes scabra]|nr:hypothetical protein [Stylosanthes scabra]
LLAEKLRQPMDGLLLHTSDRSTVELGLDVRSAVLLICDANGPAVTKTRCSATGYGDGETALQDWTAVGGE